MTKFQKFVLYISLILLLALLIQFRIQSKTLSSIQRQLKTLKADTSINTPINSPLPDVDNSTPLPVSQDRFIRGDYQYSFYGNRPVLYFDDSLIELGMITEYGKCIRIEKNQTLCVDGESRTFLLPCRRSGGPPKTTAFAPPDDGKQDRAL